MKKVVIIAILLLIPFAGYARIGIYGNVGVAPSNFILGYNFELQIYNASLVVGYGTYSNFEEYLSHKFHGLGFSGKVYTHDRESSPYLGISYGKLSHTSARFNGVLYFDEDIYGTSIMLGYRFLLKHFLGGDLGYKYIITLGAGLSIIPAHDIPRAPGLPIGFPQTSMPGRISPMIELTIGTGFQFLPWD